MTLNKYFFIPKFEFDFDCMSLSSEYEFEFEFEKKRTSRNGVFPGGHPSKYNPARPGLTLEDGWLKINKYVLLFLTFLLFVSYPSVCMSVWLIIHRGDRKTSAGEDEGARERRTRAVRPLR